MRQILNAMEAEGIEIETVVVSGGASGAPFIRQLLADSAGVAIAGTEATEPVLLGAAMLGAVAAGRYEDLPTAMPAMSRLDAIHRPAEGETATWHRHRFAAFEALQLASRSVI
jgi:D-ribulokinase